MREISIQVGNTGKSVNERLENLSFMSTRKRKMIEEFQNRLLDDIVIDDSTDFEFTKAEYEAILSLIESFNQHYKQYGKEKIPNQICHTVSKRIILDFGLYSIPDDNGEYVIYIKANRKRKSATEE